MVDTKRLRGLIAENRLSQADVARRLGLSQRCFYNKMETGSFWVSEAKQLIEILNIDDPVPIFFADRSA